jgi:hypothetical protein
VSRVGLGDFVVDIVSGELWSAGAEGGRERIVLREQPLRVLRLLIESDGRVATLDSAQRGRQRLTTRPIHPHGHGPTLCPGRSPEAPVNSGYRTVEKERLYDQSSHA